MMKDNISDDNVANRQKDQTNLMKPSIAELCYHVMNLTTYISMDLAFGNIVYLVCFSLQDCCDANERDEAFSGRFADRNRLVGAQPKNKLFKLCSILLD